jgi:hypothetical protein
LFRSACPFGGTAIFFSAAFARSRAFFGLGLLVFRFIPARWGCGLFALPRDFD